MEKRKTWIRIVLVALALLGAMAGSARLFRAAWADSMDFHVYWKAAQAWAGHGLSPYLYDASDRGFVFKYPPWILPFFLPFGFLSFEASKAIWALIGLFCIYYAVYRLVGFGVRPKAAIISAALFWWIWLGHIYSGQFTLILMATALWAAPKDSSPGRLGFLSIVFSAKVFSLVTLIGKAREYLRWKPIAAAIGFLILLHAVVYGVFLAHGQWVGPIDLYRQWAQSASSGGQELGGAVVRGQMNHGFTAAILRAFRVDAKATYMDYAVAILLASILSVLWAWISRRLSSLESWVGWLGVGLIAHPLAWHHSFVLAYPLCAVSLDRAMTSRNKKLITLSIFGMICIGILIPNIFGMTLITPLELISIKSWGVCFSALSMVLATRSLKLQSA